MKFFKFSVLFIITLKLFFSTNSFSQITGNCIQFNTNYDAVKIPDNNTILDNLGNSFTFESWILMEEYGYYSRIIDRSDNTYDDRYILAISPENKISLNLNKNVVESESILLNQWYHIACSYDGEIAKLFLNGELVAQKLIRTNLEVTDSEIIFGNFNGIRPFLGYIDELRIWNYPRSKEEIASTMNDTLSSTVYLDPQSGLVGYWKFDKLFNFNINDFENDDIKDYSLYDNHGDMFGSPELIKSQQSITAEFFTNTNSGYNPLTVYFYDKSKVEGPLSAIEKWEWNFGDGSISNNKNPYHTYTEVGNYTVTLTVETGNFTDTAVYVDYIKVKEPKPVANFSTNYKTNYKPQIVQFYDNSTGKITERSWDFGDGHESVDKNPTHQYNDAGIYDVKLFVTGPGGVDSIIKKNYVQVLETIPSAGFYSDSTLGIEPLTVQFIDTSTGLINNWLWNFGDDNQSTEQHPTHTYEYADTFSVSLIVSGTDGVDSLLKRDYIIVENKKPIADFTSDIKVGNIPLTINFVDSTQGKITDWLWDFGDGSSSSEQNPIYTYQKTGVFTVSLTVSGPGGSNFIKKDNYIEVKETEPIASFSADTTYGQLPLTVHFFDSSQGSLTNWLWDFGDGQTSTEQNPIHTYHKIDSFSVSLNVVGPGGEDKIIKSNFIKVFNTTFITREDITPREFKLYQNYPNPFNPSTNIQFSIPTTTNVKIIIYNVNGEIIKEILNDRIQAGIYSYIFNANDLPSGMYFINMQSPEFSHTIKSILLK